MILRRLIARYAFVAAVAMALAIPLPAGAQEVVARVNGDPITAVDVTQRMRLMQLYGEKTVTREAALNALIDDELKLQTAQRYRLEINNAEIDQTISSMARRMNVSVDDFTRGLLSQGLSINALKRKLRADFAWNMLVRGKFQANLQIRERDVFLAARDQSETTTGYNFTLRPILLIVRRGSPPAVVEARRREAETLREQFLDCEQGLRLARGLRDVAIRETIIRTSADLPSAMREILHKTEVGRLTPPDITPQGVEVFALCNKTESRVSVSGALRDVREKMFAERFEVEGKRFIEELRRKARIETW